MAPAEHSRAAGCFLVGRAAVVPRASVEGSGVSLQIVFLGNWIYWISSEYDFVLIHDVQAVQKMLFVFGFVWLCFVGIGELD